MIKGHKGANPIVIVSFGFLFANYLGQIVSIELFFSLPLKCSVAYPIVLRGWVNHHILVSRITFANIASSFFNLPLFPRSLCGLEIRWTY